MKITADKLWMEYFHQNLHLLRFRKIRQKNISIFALALLRNLIFRFFITVKLKFIPEHQFENRNSMILWNLDMI